MGLDIASLRRKLIGLGVVAAALSLLWVTGILAGLSRLRATVQVTPLLFGVVGGLGLFLFGIQTMSDSLQRAAGRRLRRILELLTGGPVRGVLVGAGLTAIIQSSSATTVMVVGFVNAGLLTLVQAIGVIFGANIGTTVTAQLVAFKVSRYALPAIGLGMAVMISSRRNKAKLWGQVILGLGILFYGLTTMVRALEPLRQSPEFPRFFLQFGKEPLLGVLAGAVLTAVVQSSSATVGLVIALGTTGLIDFRTAIPLMLGDNIGTTVTALLSSIGTNREAKRAALVHLWFNIIGVGAVLVVLQHFERLIDFITPGNANSPARIARHIANAHTAFNVMNTCAQLPFIRQVARFAKWILPEGEPARPKPSLPFLQEQFLASPPVAIAQINKAILAMFERARDALKVTTRLVKKEDESLASDVFKIEDEIDRYQAEITDYISRVMGKGISAHDSETLTRMLHAVNDVESIGDYAVNIAQLIQRLKSLGQTFSEPARADLVQMAQAVLRMVGNALEALRATDAKLAESVLAEESRIDELKRQLRRRNRDRYVAFKRGQTQVQERLWGQMISNDIISNLERVADEVVNILESFGLAREDIEPFTAQEAI